MTGRGQDAVTLPSKRCLFDGHTFVLRLQSFCDRSTHLSCLADQYNRDSVFSHVDTKTLA